MGSTHKSAGDPCTSGLETSEHLTDLRHHEIGEASAEDPNVLRGLILNVRTDRAQCPRNCSRTRNSEPPRSGACGVRGTHIPSPGAGQIDLMDPMDGQLMMGGLGVSGLSWPGGGCRAAP